MIKLLKNKRGGINLRHLIFMLFMFAGIIALASIFVTNIGIEYENDDMVNDYNQNRIGNVSLIDKGQKWKNIAKDLSGKNGIPTMLIGGLEAAGATLLEVITAPITFSNMLTSTLDLVGASDELIDIAGFILSSLLYALIAFSIIKVFLRGGDI